ncbi:MAG TPA: hypothetical protein VIK25_07935 [Gemmatimonadaceae bacterium]
MRRHLLLLSLIAAAPLSAQAVIDPGMSRTLVLARLGRPAVERSTGDATYLFYANNCPRTCGMNDVVVLDKGIVVDAVFRSAKRRYSGTSSSPRSIPAAEARKVKATPAKGPLGADGPVTLSITGTKASPVTAAKPDKKPPR